MDITIKKILDELYELKNKYDTDYDEDDVKYGKYWGIREAIEVIQKHINN